MKAEARPYLNSKVKPRPKKTPKPVANGNAVVYDSTRTPVYRNGARIR